MWIPEAEPVSRENINDIAGYLENGIADFLEKIWRRRAGEASGTSL